MKTRKSWAWPVLLASFSFLLQMSTRATAQDDQQGDQDPPGRVARLNSADGSVSFRPGGEDDWVTAVPNRPLVTGDDLWADEDSRAEVHIGSTAVRLGAKTGITLLALDDQTTQIRLAQGSLILRVRHVDDDDTYEVDTPNLAFTLLQPGEYRIDVSEDGSQTVTTVWHGRGRVTGGGFSYSVLAHQSAVFRGSDHLDYDIGQIPEADDLDHWAFNRDEREDHADSADYVSREMTGYEDLDESGDWSYVAGYGPCWRPRAVVVGWAPYRFGHWTWVGPWGWTWVEDEPWGFAPFHYGRWAFVSGGWFWVPGPVVVRPVWAPALVAFVGGGGVGWFPLAPGEVFVPGYRVSRTYVNNVNITNTSVNITKITNVYNTVVIDKSTNINRIAYVNQHVNGGVTVVSRETFANARPVARNAMRVDAKEMEAAPVTHVAAVEPVRTSVFGAGRPAPVKPPAAVISRPVVAQRTPPPAPRSFQQQQTRAGGRLNQQPLVRPETQVTATQPTRPYQTSQGAKPQTSQEGFRPFTPPSGGNSQVRQSSQPPPRVMEGQGTPQPENRDQQAPQRSSEPAENRNSRPFPPPQREETRPAPQETHPLVRQAPPVEERNPQQEQQQEQKFREWQQQRPASPPPSPPAQRPQNSRPPEPRQEKPPKK
jgi:hypothetical protein